MLKSMKIELEQMLMFFNDLEILTDKTGDEYQDDLKELRDETDRLRSEYATLYAKILSEHQDLIKYMG